MGNVLIKGEFHRLRVNEYQTQLRRIALVEQREDHRVDADRLARAGGAAHQHVGHARQIDDERLAGDVLAQRKRKQRFAFLELLAADHLGQVDGHALLDSVRNLKPHVRSVGNRRNNADRMDGERSGQILADRLDMASLDAVGKLQPVLGNDGPGLGSFNFSLDPIGAQLGLDEAARHFDRLFGNAPAVLWRLGERGNVGRDVSALLLGKKLALSHGAPRLWRLCRFRLPGLGRLLLGRRSPDLASQLIRRRFFAFAERHVNHFGLGSSWVALPGFLNRLSLLSPLQKRRLNRFGLRPSESLCDAARHADDEKNAFVNQLPDLLAQVQPREAEHVGKSHGAHHGEDQGRSPDAQVRHGLVGHEPAEQPARSKRQMFGKVCKLNGFQTDRGADQNQKPDQRGANSQFKRLAALPFDAPANAQQQNGKQPDDDPPDGKSEHPVAEIGNPRTDKPAHVVRRLRARGGKARIGARIRSECNRRKTKHHCSNQRQGIGKSTPCKGADLRERSLSSRQPLLSFLLSFQPLLSLAALPPLIGDGGFFTDRKQRKNPNVQ